MKRYILLFLLAGIVATAQAREVFPVPGGPYIRT